MISSARRLRSRCGGGAGYVLGLWPSKAAPCDATETAKRRNGGMLRWAQKVMEFGIGSDSIYIYLYISIDAPSPIHMYIYIHNMSSILWRLDMLDSMYLLDETTAIVDSIFLTSSFSSGSSEHFMASFLDDFWCLFPPKKNRRAAFRRSLYPRTVRYKKWYSK